MLILSIWILVLTSLLLVSCDNKEDDDEHTHKFGKWSISTQASCTTPGMQARVCKSCDFTEYSHIPMLEHTVVSDAAVSATCLSDGKTAGSHCDVCNTVILAQTAVPATGHTSVTDPAVAATCTENGKTEGSHCSICKTAIVEQKNVEALGHQWDDGRIIQKATCIQEGIKEHTCTVEGCGGTKEEAYAMPTFTSTELYNQSIQYVGEIVTYDQSGAEYALGTGFVLSSDGKIVTNYHVMEGAYSATICINGTTYNITSVLAYNKEIDLAILKVKASGLTTATICKNPVQAGETVYAIGSSRGMTNTYSQGIVTHADREVDGVVYVQHDASITAGNSGGPLINDHGEVIGINTWAISDSQNLNFAVFTAELDNLAYGKALTIPEFYQKECNVFEKLKNYIISEGSYNSSIDAYCLLLDTVYSDDYTYEYTRMAYYYAAENLISLDWVINEGENWVYFVIDETVDGTYEWEYFDESDYFMSGTLYAETYDENTLLGYSQHNIDNPDMRDLVRSLSSSMISTLCMCIEIDFADIGITAADLHFYNY